VNECQPISTELRQRLIAAAERPLRVRREAFKLAGFATGHRKKAHGQSCSECKEHWPCALVRRAAAPLLEAYSESFDHYEELAKRRHESGEE
jgi:hypothetical protein